MSSNEVQVEALPGIRPPSTAKLVTSKAVISDDGVYRYRLARTWDPSIQAALFVMLNPSTADAEVDDPTIRRCMGFARRWGCGGVRVVNLYAYRSTDPKGLWLADDPVGPENDDHLAWAAESAHAPLVAAWGANARPDRVADALTILSRQRRTVYALGLTKDGHPRHPLYVRGDTDLVTLTGGGAS